ncbi:hypothetical protein DMB66_18450 [Actinoplanes sp. ATCC 53533]|uniref:hypothetical protein n=1 Tax=Actinoplanes sp. ATCC 53533 TaxID=1288362 RepID=UPI000F780D66|nr:hypothetical protein [Actinoplanes sp. ATCC 53533]RSM64895.1 hypothetical protein DMB66_18450 [Actinoplanes sp. ATCC 53533]
MEFFVVIAVDHTGASQGINLRDAFVDNARRLCARDGGQLSCPAIVSIPKQLQLWSGVVSRSTIRPRSQMLSAALALHTGGQVGLPGAG